MVAPFEALPEPCAYHAVFPGLPFPLPSLGNCPSGTLLSLTAPPIAWRPVGQTASPEYWLAAGAP
jgi:hypothetical protein